MKSNMKEIQQNLLNLISDASLDSVLKSKLISNPKVFIESELGYKISIADSLVIEDQSDINTIYFNIPRKSFISDYELTENELDNISGGIDWKKLGRKFLLVKAVNYIVGEFAAGVNDVLKIV